MMKVSPLLLITLASALLSTLALVTASDCNPGEELLEFTLFLDEDSDTENGWYLTCDGEGTIWNMPVGSMQTANQQSPGYIQNDGGDEDGRYVRDHVCLPVDFTCHFTLEDTFGDGLLSPGYFFLTFGATTIVVSEPEEEFQEKNLCFGPNCPMVPQEVAETCDNVFLYLRTDEKPTETTFTVDCNGSTLFSKSDFVTPFEEVEHEECIPTGTCCTMKITDTGNNGLTTGSQVTENGNEFASVYVEWANERVFMYDGSDGYKFGAVSLDFGSNCPYVAAVAPPVDEVTEGQPSVTTPTTVNQDGQVQEKTTPKDPLVVEADPIKKATSQSQTSSEDNSGLSKGGLICSILVGVLALIGLFGIVLFCQSRDQGQTEEQDLKMNQSKDTDIEDEP